MQRRTLGVVVAVLLAAGGLWSLAGGGQRRGESDASFRTWGTPGRKTPLTFDRPRCVAAAPDGTLWVLDLTGRIQHCTPDGAYLGEIRMPDVTLGRPQGMDVDEHGCIYVADTHYNQILKFAPSGKILLRFGTQGLAPGKFFWPCAIAVAADGTIYTAEYGGVTEEGYHDRIQKWSPAGEPLAHWGRFGEEEGQFMRPAGLDLGPDGNLYVADSANHRIQVFTPQGALLRGWGLQGKGVGELYYPYDIAVDAAGRVYVVEYGASRVQVFSAEGQLRGVWGRLSRGGEGLFQPWGIEVFGAGQVFVADTLNHRVVRVPLSVAPQALTVRGDSAGEGRDG